MTNASAVIEIKTDDEYASIYDATMKSGQILVTDFSGSFCQPCKRIYPTFQRLAKMSRDDAETRDLFVFVKVDITQCHATADSRGVASVPMFVVDFESQVFDTLLGANEQALFSLVERSLLYWRKHNENKVDEQNKHQVSADIDIDDKK